MGINLIEYEQAACKHLQAAFVSASFNLIANVFLHKTRV